MWGSGLDDAVVGLVKVTYPQALHSSHSTPVPNKAEEEVMQPPFSLVCVF
jgi:hypothetical protein